MAKVLKSKKGQLFTLKNLVLFAVVTLVLFTFFGYFLWPYLSFISDKEVCRLSVISRYSEKLAGAGTEGGVPLQCFTQKVTIRSDGIYKMGRSRKEKKIESFPGSSGGLGAVVGVQGAVPVTVPEAAGTEPAVIAYGTRPGEMPRGMSESNWKRIDLVKKTVADEMANCWEQFLYGKAAIFTSGRRCVICSEIRFEPDWLDFSAMGDFADEYRNRIPYFGEYLNTEEIKKGKTYALFLREDLEEKRFHPEIDIKTRVKTNIVFTAFATSWWDKAIGATTAGCVTAATLAVPLVVWGPLGVGAGIGATAGGCLAAAVVGVVGATWQGETWKPVLLMGPSGLVAQRCDRLY